MSSMFYDRNPKQNQGFRPQPWRPTLSTDAPDEKPKCLGDLVREEAARGGRVGSAKIGTAGDGDHQMVESWYVRHPDKLPANPMMMTDAAQKLRAAILEKERLARKPKTEAQRERERDRDRDRRDRKRKRNAKPAATRTSLEGATGWNTRRPRMKPSFHNPALLLGRRRRDPLLKSVPDKPLKRFTIAEEAT